MLVAPPRKYFFENGTSAWVAAAGRDVAELQAARQHDLVAERQVVPAVHRHRVVIERARQQLPRLLGVKRDLIAAVRVQHVVGRRVLEIEADRVQRAALLAGASDRGRAR